MARKRRKKKITGNPLIDPEKFYITKDGKLMPREKSKKPKKKS